jgi:hypothetical protein
MRKITLFAAGAFAVGVLTLGRLYGQGDEAPKADVPESGTMTFESRLGSFVLIDGRGRLEITFRGTFLLQGYEGAPPVIEGTVRKEYEGYGRSVWFGTGRAVLDGKWRKVQWFGGDMKATWTGAGLARFFGEYDSESRTGFYQYEGEARRDWVTFGMDAMLPKEADPRWQAEQKGEIPQPAPGGAQQPPTGQYGDQPAAGGGHDHDGDGVADH